MRNGTKNCILLASSALSGALVFPLSERGRVAPANVTREWVFLLATAWVALVGWALLYVLIRRKLVGDHWGRAFCWAAACHSPMLLCIGLVISIYGNDLTNHLFTNSAYGKLVYQPLAKGYVILFPALFQLFSLIRWDRQALRGALPIAFVTIVALSLRLWNINWGLPALLHPDEHQYIGRGFLMWATGDPNPRYFENPSLVIYIVDALYLLISSKVQALHVAAEMLGMSINDPRGDYFIVMAARGASALAGALTVTVVYLVGRRLFGRDAALSGAAVLAVSLLHVRNSHYTTNDVMATFLMTLSLLFTIRIYSRGRPADYLLAGLIGGLGVSAKYNVGFFCVAILTAHLARLFKPGLWNRQWVSHIPLLLAAAASLGGFLAATPFSVLDYPSFIADFRNQYGYGGENWLGQNALPAPILYLATLTQGFGLLPLILAVAGALFTLRYNRSYLLILIAAPAAYLAFMFTQRLYFARFALPVLPYLAVLAGFGISKLAQSAGRSARQTGFQLLLLGLAIAQPLAMAVQSNLLLGKEDTRYSLSAWIDEQTEPGDSIAMEAFAHLDNKFYWTGYQGRNTFVYWPESAAGRARAVSGDYQYVVTSTFGYAAWQLEGAPGSLLPDEYRLLEREGRLLAIIAPGPMNGDIPYSQDDMYTPFWHLFDRERPGPTIKIYRLERSGG